MNSRVPYARSALSFFVAAVLLTVLAVPAGAAGGPSKDDAESGRLSLYPHPEEMSGAAINVLSVQPGAAVPGSGVPFAATDPGSLVNDPATDTTSQDTQSETSLTLAGSNVIVGFNDSGSCLPNCPTGSNQFTGYGLSTDGGATFTDKGRLPASAEGDAGDPVLATDTTAGATYLATLGFTTGECLQVFKSTNGGSSYGAPVCATPGFGGTKVFQDKEWMAVDNFGGSGQGNVYMAWRAFPPNASPVQGGIKFVRSTDHGATWGPSQGLLIASPGSRNVQGASVAVGPDHAVYVFWLDQSAGAATPNIIKVRKSTDQGQTFAPAVTVATLADTATNGDLNLLGQIRSNSFPSTVVNPVNGNLYVVWNDLGSGADHGDIYLSTSSDAGATWSSAAKVNDDGTATDQFFPSITVTPNGTAAYVAYYDRRADPADFLIQRRGRIADVSGTTLTFHKSFSLSPVFIPVRDDDRVVNGTYMGDYDQAVADNTSFSTSYSDNRDGDAFFPHQPDVRFAKIPVGASGTTADLGVTMTGTPAEAAVGETVTYKIVVTNNGPGTDQFVSLRDLLDPKTTFVSATATQGSCYGGLIPSCELGSLAAGASATVNLVAMVTAPGALSNAATVEGAATDSASANDAASATGTGTGAGIPSPFSTGNIAVPIPDTTVTTSTLNVPSSFQLSDVNVSLRLNHTFDADLDMTLIAPDGTRVKLAYDQGGSGDNYGSGANDCSGTPTVFDDEASTSIFAGTPPYAGSFRPENPLSALDGKLSGGIWKLEIFDDAQADVGTLGCWNLELSRPTDTDLRVAMTDAPDPAKVGKKITYTATVTNLGPDAATDVDVSDVLPKTVKFLSASPSQGSCSGGKNLVCDLGPLASGGAATVKIVVKPKSTGKVANTAVVSGPERDPIPANDKAKSTTKVKP